MRTIPWVNPAKLDENRIERAVDVIQRLQRKRWDQLMRHNAPMAKVCITLSRIHRVQRYMHNAQMMFTE